MERRNFFRNTALYAGTALAAARNYGFGSGEFSGVIKKGIQFQMVDEKAIPVIDRFKLLKDLGFDGTELRTIDREQRVIFTKAIQQTDFPVHSIAHSGPTDLSDAIELAADLGASSVHFRVSYDQSKPWLSSWHDWQAQIQQTLPIAEKHSITLLVENDWSGLLVSPLDIDKYINDIDHPLLGTCFNTGNCHRYGIPTQWIEVLGKRIHKLSISEWDEQLYRTQGLNFATASELGDGTVEWQRIRSALREQDFTGYATADCRGGNRIRLMHISQRMDQVLGLV